MPSVSDMKQLQKWQSASKSNRVLPHLGGSPQVASTTMTKRASAIDGSPGSCSSQLPSQHSSSRGGMLEL